MFESKKFPNEPSRFTGGAEFDRFMIWSTNEGTSDVTIQSDEQIICDIHGKKHRVTNRKLTTGEVTEIISYIYRSDGALSMLNGGKDVDLQWGIKIDRQTTLRYRINMTAILSEGLKGYQITIRTITGRAPLLESLKVPQEVVDAMCVKQGLVIITGATGSGKSTLLASLLDWRMRQEDAHLKILTYEAPIEYVYDDVPKPTTSIAQTEIGNHLPSFEAGVRNALRRKPDIILMGEMRDRETIGEGVTASTTGHLVYGTLHTNGVADAIRRMVNVFDVEEKASRALDILSSLKVALSQMLVPSTDGKRVAIREYLIFNNQIVDAILEAGVENLTAETKKQLIAHGVTFAMDAKQKFDEGIISQREYDLIVKSTMG